jgi:hypothetical protein
MAAGPDGTATVTYTPGSWGYTEVRVTSVRADGNKSDLRIEPFDDDRGAPRQQPGSRGGRSCGSDA